MSPAVLTGRIDPDGRPLVRITVRQPHTGARLEVEANIDTGFTGELVLTPSQVAGLGLPYSGDILGQLADGSGVVLRTHTCSLAWFGTLRQIEAIAGNTRFALIGVGLLADLRLTVD